MKPPKEKAAVSQWDAAKQRIKAEQPPIVAIDLVGFGGIEMDLNSGHARERQRAEVVPISKRSSRDGQQ